MLLRPHQALQIEQRRVGPKRTPLLIIDSLVDDPDRLVRKAQRAHFAPQGTYFPGIRARAPLSYEVFVEQALGPLLRECFGLPAGRLHFPMCHYSLVTLAPERLQPLQQIPHVDSTDSLGLASVHYLFKGPWDGTDFYRHRATGLSVIDAGSSDHYFAALQSEMQSHRSGGYINGDTDCFERIGGVEAAYNRIVIYPRNLLHSGRIDNAQLPPTDPLDGRLSINCFIDAVV